LRFFASIARDDALPANPPSSLSCRTVSRHLRADSAHGIEGHYWQPHWCRRREPKTSGGARWNFLAALAWAQREPGATEASAEAFMRDLFHHVPVLDTGARGATNTFAQRGLGDVLLAWENGAWLARKELGADEFTIVYPSLSILAEPPVAVVDRVVDKKGTRAVAEAYLRFLYSKEGQDIVVKHYYRPRDPTVGGNICRPLSCAEACDDR
jgi:sulfate/thiosulfate-binding protein